jgi:hypothetical protein
VSSHSPEPAGEAHPCVTVGRRDCYGQDGKDGKEQQHPTVDWKQLRNGGDFSTELIKLVQAPRPPHPAVARAAAREGDGSGMEVPCIDSDGADHWLNNPAVKEALHVASSPMTWSICSEAINMHWNRGEFPDGMPPIYKELMPHLDIMVYNGAGNTCLSPPPPLFCR